MKKVLTSLLVASIGLFPTLSGLQPAYAAEPTAQASALPQAGETPLISFPVLSNTLLLSDVASSSDKLGQALDDLHAIDPDTDALVIDGDIVAGATKDEYDVLNQVLQNHPHPQVFTTIGNHEFYHAWYDQNGNWSPATFPNGESDQDSINRYLTKTGAGGLYYDQWVGGYHFVFLGSEKYRQSDPSVADNAFLSQDQLDWLSTKLAQNASLDKPIFLFLHQSMSAVIQSEELQEILKRYPQVIWFHGDPQMGFNYTPTMVKNKYTVFNTSSVFRPLNASGQEIGPDASEGLYVQVFQDRVVVKARDFAAGQWMEGHEYTVDYPVPSAEDPEAPTWPQDSVISLFNLRDTSVHLSWTRAQDNIGVAKYRIFRDGTAIATIGATEPSYVAAGLTPETSYTFKVEARDEWGNWSTTGPSVTVTTVKTDLPDGEPLLEFPVLSDIHVNAYNPPSYNKFKNALSDLHEAAPNADTLVVNGDLTVSGWDADYDKMNEILGQVPHAPVEFTMGNHEFYKAWYNAQGDWDMDNFPNGETEQMSIDRFLQKTGSESLYRDKWINDYHFIFLSSEQYRQSSPSNGEDAFLSETQLTWLEQKLAEGASKDKPIFVFLHQPLPYTVSGSDIWINNRAVIQHERLTEILAKYPQTIYFSGHTHWTLNMPTTIAKNQFTMFNSSTTWDPLNSNDQSIGPNESEGLYVKVYPYKVVVAGRDFYRKQWIPGQEYSVNYTPEPDLVNYDFAESATHDSSPAGNDGTAVGQPVVQYDNLFEKNVLVLDGQSYVRIPDNAGLRPKTVTMAVSFAMDTLDGYQDIVAKNQSSDYGLEFNPDTKRLEAWIYVKDAGGGGGYVVTQSPVLEAQAKYNAAVTYNGEEAVFYLNGERVDSEQAAGEIGQAGDPVDLAIGVDPEPDGGARSYFTGKIGYVKIYSRALTHAQITGVEQSVDTNKPVWPNGSSVTAANATTTSVDLSWTAATDNVGVKSYKVFKDGVLAATVDAGTPAYKVTGLKPETTYTFKVEAGDLAGNWTDNGPSVTATTAPLVYEDVGAPDLLDYTFAESAVKDSSPAHNDGVIVGTATVAYDEAFGKNALALDGNSYIRIADNAGLRPQHITLAAAFSLDTLDGTQDIIAKNQSSDYGFEYNPGTKQLESWTYIQGNDGSAGYVVLKSEALQAGTVYHAVTTYDGNENALYLNGVKVDSATKPGTIGQAAIVDLTIGADPEVSGARSFLKGKVGLAQIYSQGLTAGQVATLYKRFANPLQSLSVELPSTLHVGESAQATVKAAYRDGTTQTIDSGVRFVSSNPQAASVDPATGLVQALSGGETVITAEYGGKSAEAHVTVLALNTAPTVTMLSPSDGATFTSPAAIVLKAQATDSDGQVAKVEFYSGGVKLGSGQLRSDGMYGFDWRNVAAGTYSITAVATDNVGASAVSAAVTVTVGPPAPVTLKLSRTKLWPANHKLIPIQAEIQYEGKKQDIASVELVSITSNESAEGDIQGAAFGTADMLFQLRAERSPHGKGRVYTITYKVTFTSGDTAVASGTVNVPHDASGKDK